MTEEIEHKAEVLGIRWVY